MQRLRFGQKVTLNDVQCYVESQIDDKHYVLKKPDTNDTIYAHIDSIKVGRRFKPGDKVVVNGLDLAFVIGQYISDRLVQIFIEGESRESGKSYYVVYAKEEVLLLNDTETLIEQEWSMPPQWSISPQGIKQKSDIWEVKIVFEGYNIEEILNKYCEQGWEPVNISYNPNSSCFIAMLKRKKQCQP